MGLYIVYTPSITERKSEYVFFESGHQCFRLEGRKEILLFDLPNEKLSLYKQIINYTEKERIDSFEIVLPKDESLVNVFMFLCNYLLDKDVSIGLLTTDPKLIDKHDELITSFGITTVSKTDFVSEPQWDKGQFCFELLTTPILRKEVHPKAKIHKKPSGPKSTIKLDESFHDKFLRFLIESGKDNVEVYKKAGVSRQVFSKIISDKNMIPTRLTLVSLCIGLELTLREARELMNSAGYSLTKSLMFDAVIIKYLEDEIYDLDLINSELYEYGCQLLGWHPRDN